MIVDNMNSTLIPHTVEKYKIALYTLCIEKNPVRANIIRKATSTGRPLGDVTFVEKLEELSGRHLKPQKRGRPRRNEE